MTTKTKKTKKWSFPRWVKIYKDGETEPVVNVVTQLYQIGVYVCEYYGNTSSPNQFGMKPSGVKNYFSKQFSQDNLKPGYTVELGPEITVTEDENGFYKEVELT